MLGASCLLALSAAVRFAPTPSLRPPLATLFVEAKTSALVSSLETFLRFPRFPQVVFSDGIELISTKSDVADCEDTVMIIDEPCAAVTWLKLL
ncbi:hypothetical protein TNCV_5057131 [Trichonephila clavipes]|nr:hypothetical protein TNCV_5057131 [Trichonephila clavipes]